LSWHRDTPERERRAEAVRPLVRAEFDRLRALPLSKGDTLKTMGIHLRLVSERLARPLVADAYGSVQHLLHGHAGLHCCCKDNAEGECSATPEGYVLDAFEAAAGDYPILEPRKLAASQRKPVTSRKHPLAQMAAEGVVTLPRRR